MEARETLVEYGAVYLDRGCLFVSTTGKLLSGYVNCEVIFPHHQVVVDLTQQLVEPFIDEVEVFLCPATGDIVLAMYANFMANDDKFATMAVWADKRADGSYRVERSGFEAAARGKKVLILNDRISQGGTTLKIIAEAHRLDCEILGVATLAGVSAVTAETLDVPVLNALCTVDVQVFADDAIPPEFQGLPIAIDEALGHGADYQKEHPDYPGGFIEINVV
jgi:orotate phosphoribosyltransferase